MAVLVEMVEAEKKSKYKFHGLKIFKSNAAAICEIFSNFTLLDWN